MLDRDAGPAIAHRQRRPRARAAHLDHDRRLRRRLGRVAQEVPHHLPELRRIGVDLDRRIGAQLDARVAQPLVVLEHFQHLGHRRRYVEPLGLERPRPRELEQLRDQPIEPLDLADHDAHQLLVLFGPVVILRL